VIQKTRIFRGLGAAVNHHSVAASVTFRVALFVLRSVGQSACMPDCLSVKIVLLYKPCKTAEPIAMSFRMWTRVGLSNHVLVAASDRRRTGQF